MFRSLFCRGRLERQAEQSQEGNKKKRGRIEFAEQDPASVVLNHHGNAPCDAIIRC